MMEAAHLNAARHEATPRRGRRPSVAQPSLTLPEEPPQLMRRVSISPDDVLYRLRSTHSRNEDLGMKRQVSPTTMEALVSDKSSWRKVIEEDMVGQPTARYSSEDGMASEPADPEPLALTGDKNIDQVLRRLDDVARKVDGVAAGQRFAEGFMKRLYQELLVGPTEQLVVERAARRQARRPSVPEAKMSESVSQSPHDKKNQKEQFGFWPRVEWTLSTNSGPPRNTLTKGFELKMVRTPSMAPAAKCWCKPIHPDSWVRAIFDFFSVLVLLYDSILIPYQLAQPLAMEGSMLVLSWLSFGFWTADLIMGFVTGYHNKDGVVMDFRLLCRRHLCGSFLPDLLVLVADFLSMAQTSTAMQDHDEGVMRETLLFKMLRFLKLRRVIRLASSFRHGKVAEAREWLANLLRQHGVNEQFEIAMRIFNLVFYIVWVNHLGGCLWQLMAKETTAKWLNEHGLVDKKEEAFDYMLGFYISATAMIAGGSVMVPTNTYELIGLVLYIVLGFILSSILISSLLATVMEYQDANRSANEKLKSLQQFLYQHSIDPKLAVPIVKQVHERMWSRKQLAEGDVEALSLLSPAMRSELWYHLYGPNILENPFLCACNVIKHGLIKEICFRSLRRSSHTPGTLVFEPGVEAVGAHFVCSGTLDYIAAQAEDEQDDSDVLAKRTVSRRESDKGDEEVAEAGEGAWLCEVAFWAHWLHRGWLDARTPVELMTVEAEKFVQVVSANPDLARVVQSYTSCMLKALEDGSPEFTDLQSLPHHSIVAAMPLPDRVVLSQAAMDFLMKAQWSGRLFQQPEGIKELKDEINSGACDLMMSKDNEVRRVVTIVALQLRRLDGHILSRIGKCSKGSAAPSCELPGGKVKIGEYPRTAMERFMKEKLGSLANHIHLGSYTMNIQEKVSKSFGLKSKYYRLVFEGELLEEPSDYMWSLESLGTPSIAAASSQSGFSIKRSVFRNESEVCSSPSKSAHTQAFVFRTDAEKDCENIVLFAWIKPETYRLLSSPSGEHQLQDLVKDLDLTTIRPDVTPTSSLVPARRNSTFPFASRMLRVAI